MLYGYGGFSISETPYFSVTVASWLEMGGIYAVPNIRGGGKAAGKWITDKARTILSKI